MLLVGICLQRPLFDEKEELRENLSVCKQNSKILEKCQKFMALQCWKSQPILDSNQ